MPILRERRLRAGLSTRKLGAILRRSAPAIVAYEKGDRKCPLDVVVCWLDACNATDADRLAVMHGAPPGPTPDAGSAFPPPGSLRLNRYQPPDMDTPRILRRRARAARLAEAA
jgi:hypothetical protein